MPAMAKNSYHSLKANALTIEAFGLLALYGHQEGALKKMWQTNNLRLRLCLRERSE